MRSKKVSEVVTYNWRGKLPCSGMYPYLLFSFWQERTLVRRIITSNSTGSNCNSSCTYVRTYLIIMSMELYVDLGVAFSKNLLMITMMILPMTKTILLACSFRDRHSSSLLWLFLVGKGWVVNRILRLFWKRGLNLLLTKTDNRSNKRRRRWRILNEGGRGITIFLTPS